MYPVRTAVPPEEIEKMDREMVESETLLSVGYDSATETLEVEFTNGGIYQYYNVPVPIHRKLMASESKGKFLNVYIKPAYPYSRV
jgi:hypothetical protein